MNKSKYLEKCLTVLNSEQFVRVNEDPAEKSYRECFVKSSHISHYTIVTIMFFGSFISI